MSQFSGILHFDGKAPEGETIQRMMAACEESCPDGSGIWHGANIALGFSLLKTLPSCRCVSEPFRDAESSLVIVADARIDNRLELAGQLGFMGDRQRSDAEFILCAYGKWGEACVEHLIGDFAFALWDERQHTLFCARDSFGVRPFHYFHSRHAFIFSSTILSLLQTGEVSRELNEEFIADSLAGLMLEGNVTVYKEISSLPAAHCLSVRDGKISRRCYWQPGVTNQIVFSREEEYVERYRELFTEAVRCRLETDGEAASLLSGGLDSGAIAAVAGQLLAARNKRLSTFSFVLADKERQFNQDEKHLITLLHDLQGVDGTFISSDNFIEKPLHRYYDFCSHLPVGHSPYLATLFSQLRNKNTRVLLDGGGGDLCATCAISPPLQEFLTGFQMGRLFKYIRAASGFNGRSTSSIIKMLLTSHLKRPDSHDKADIVVTRSVLAEEFRERVQIMERARRNRRFMPANNRSLRDRMRQLLLLVEKGFRQAELFSLSQVELRHPMMDRRLVDFCLAVPVEQHNYDMNRRLIRRAMQGLLPDEVRLRHNKNISNMPGATDSVFTHRDFFLESMNAAEQNSLVTDYIEIGKLKKRFTEALPEAVNKTDKSAFMTGPTMRGFFMLQFLMNHASACTPQTTVLTCNAG